MSNDRVFCQPCTCERCRRNNTDRFCAICCVESGNAFIDDLITNSFDDLLNSSDNRPQHQTHSFESNDDPPQNFDFLQLIGEMCGIKASAEQKQKLEEMMLEWLELCQEKELYRMHDKTESDEVIKSSVENLVPIPSESEVTSDNKSEFDVPVNDESSPIFTTFSNPLFDCNDDFTSSDDNLIDSSPKFDYLLEEFSGELTHIDPIPPGIEEADFDLEEEIRLVENLLYDNSSPRPLKELKAEIADTIHESLSSFPILVEVSDSPKKGIDLFLAMDDLMPLGIENDDYDSERDIHFLEELLSHDPFPLPENESSNFDHHDDPSFPRPPPKPPNVEVFFDFYPDTGVLTTKMVKGISEHYVLMPNILPTLSTLDLDLDFTPSHDSLGSGNKIFDSGIFIEV
nr:hypothetical protein [Tanacetum cinerariifolium]